jgi:AcrR family transcriptional regulator
MEAAAAASQRSLPGAKAQRIVDAMRTTVARRGTAGATFDQVAREAGVSRGLLHYYFGSKERLLVEVVRRDCEVRLGVLDEQLAGARSADDFIALLVFALKDLVRSDPEFITVVFELFSLAQRNDEIAVEFADVMRRTREHVADLLAAKQDEGVLRLLAEPEALAEILFALADGVALRMLAEPERDFGATIAAGVTAVRALIANV